MEGHEKNTSLDNSQLVNVQKFIVNDSVISDKHDIANAFNNYFTSIGPTLASSITSNTNPILYINIVLLCIWQMLVIMM